MINETGIFFFPGGGHDHDGQNSSLINVTAYSVFDFEWSTTLGGPDRIRRLDRNYTAFREFIINTVNQSILNPAGIFYQPGSINGGSHIISNSITSDQIAANTITSDQIAANTIAASNILAGTITANEIASNTITADEIASNTITAAQIASNTITANQIAAGTITGDLLSANVVLVNQIIASNNYVPGVSGWAIDGDGTAEFSNSIFRGTVVTSNITATAGTIGDLEISGGAVEYNDAGTSSFLRLGPQTWPSNDGSAALVISSSYGGGSFVRIRPSGIDGAGSVTSDFFVGSFGRIDEYRNSSGGDASFYGNLYGTADDANTLAGYSADFNDNGNTVPIRGNDASIRAGYLVMLGGVGIGGGDEVRKRNDGYLLTFTSRRELKNSIENIDSDFALSIINSLQPVSFRMNQPQYIGDLFSEREATYREYGFIAQDVAEVDANLATYGLNDEGNAVQPKAWSSHTMISLSVAAIQGLITEIDNLKARISILEQ